MHLFGHNFDHDYYFELLRKGERDTQQLLGDRLHTIAISGLSRERTPMTLCTICAPICAAPFVEHPARQKTHAHDYVRRTIAETEEAISTSSHSPVHDFVRSKFENEPKPYLMLGFR